jgi:hypothetical protein
MVSVQSKVAELADMTELPRGGKIIDMIQWQIGSMLGMPVGPRPKADASAQANYAQPVYAAQTQQAVPTIQGTLVPGATLAEKLAWLQRSADSHNTYVLEVSADENIAPHTFEYKGAINITIVLRGVGGNRTIRLKSHGTMFTVKQNVTFVLDNNITLHGHNGNTGSMVCVDGGTLKMNATATIIGNLKGINTDGAGGVQINSGTFEMTGGVISGNSAMQGGVYLNYGTFTMNGGTISNNTAKWGGGVCMQRGKFTMNGGNILGNTSTNCGGGVHISGSANTATFIMHSGNISNNISNMCGGGVVVGHKKGFTKTGGTITGYNSDQNNGNVVNDGSGAIARKGHAVYYNENKRKETTAGPGVKLCTDNSCSGGWDE